MDFGELTAWAVEVLRFLGLVGFIFLGVVTALAYRMARTIPFDEGGMPWKSRG